MTLLRTLWSFALALALAGPAQAQFVAVPPLAHHVTDQAGMLDAAQRAKLEAQLADYEAKTGSQIAVLTVQTTAPEQIEQYSVRVVEAWKLGRKGVDDGVLLLVAPGNTSAMRRLRIEAGRGVQGVLTDARSKQILQDVIAPYFKQQQYYEGLAAGVGAIASTLNAEKFPPPPAAQRPPQRQHQQESGGGFSMLIPLLFFGFLFLMKLLHRGNSRLASNGWGSGAAGFVLGAAIDSLSRGGGGGGGFSGGGGSSGGGFSGGGGSFDGGGASGDW